MTTRQTTSAREARRRFGSAPAMAFLVAALLACAYAAYWFWLQGELRKGVIQWIAQERALGAEVDYAALEFGGFPFRFTLRAEDAVYRPVGAPQRLKAEELRLVMDSFDVLRRFVTGAGGGKLIASAPGDGRIEPIYSGAPLDLRFGPRSALSLEWTTTALSRLGVTIDSLDYAGAAGPGAVTGLALNAAAHGDSDEDLRLTLAVDEAVLPAPVSGVEWLGDTMRDADLALEATKFFTALQSPTAISRWISEGGRIKIAGAQAAVGPATFGMKGDLGLDPSWRLNGELSVRLDDPEALRAALRDAGRLTEEATVMIDIVARASEDGGFATIPFKDGAATMMGRPIYDVPVADVVAALLAPS